MRKGIIIGIGVLLILLALAGTVSAHPSYTFTACTGCHNAGGFNGTLFNDTHKFNGTSAPIVDSPPGNSCAYCHILPPTNATNYNMNRTTNGSLYNSTHRYNATTLASVKLIGTTGCYNCHVNVNGSNFTLISGAGILLSNNTCGYCHTKLVDDWNLSNHSNPYNTSKSVVTCVTCHLEHNATRGIETVATINTSCLNSTCHGSATNTVRKHGTPGYNITQCKYCHLPKVLTVNTTFDTLSHTWDFRTQLVDQGDERHAAVFGTLKNVTKNDTLTKASCDMCHGASEIPSVNFRAAYRLTAHYNASANNISSNAATPYCTDCHKTALTTEAKLINESNTCRVGCHVSKNETHANNTGGADCTKCHFNNSNPLKTHNLYFNNASEYNYTCTYCHTANSNRSIVRQINEWNGTAHNDRNISVNKSSSSSFYFNATAGTVKSRANSCLKCHSPMNWNPGIAESVTTSVTLTANFSGIVCSICHNIHDMGDWLNNTGKVYAWYNRDAIQVSSTVYQANYTNVTDTTELCGNCHSNVKYGNTGPGWASSTSTTPIYPHGFPAKDMFMGSPKQSGQGFECIDCHMYKNTTYGTGSQSDSVKITGHSFAVNESALQNTSCGTTCHNGTIFKTIPDIIEEIQTETQDKWNTTNSSVMAALENYRNNPVNTSSRDNLSKAYWNLKLVSSDESWGVHNPEATIELLDDALALANASNASLGQGLSNVDLVTGWNLVALNGTPSVTLPYDVLASVRSNITVVWGYNATSSAWLLYDPVMPTSLNSLTAMVPGKGFWIKATQACKWTV